MGKFKVHSSNNFTIINNSVFYNRNISWKAKGILTQMLSLPETWDYTEAGLATLSTDGITSTRTALKELEKAGYLVRSFIRNERGKIADIDYDIYEIPIQDDESPLLENPITGSTNMRSSVETDNPTMGSRDITDSPTMLSPVITDSATMRSSVSGFSNNAENKPFTGHPLLGSPITVFPLSEIKHNKKLNIINNQLNKEPTTVPNTDDRNVGSPECGSVVPELSAGRTACAGKSKLVASSDNSDMSSFKNDGCMTAVQTGSSNQSILTDGYEKVDCHESGFQYVEDLSDDAVTGFSEAEHHDDVTSAKSSDYDKENHDLNECVESDLVGNDDLKVRDVLTKERMDVPVSDDGTGNHSISLSIDKSGKSDGVVESNQPSEILSDRAVKGSVSVNDTHDVTSSGLAYDDNDYHDLNECVGSGLEECDQLYVGELSTNEKNHSSAVDSRMNGTSMSLRINKNNQVIDTDFGYGSNQPSENMSGKAVKGSVSANDTHDVTSSDLAYDDNDYHDLNEGMGSGSEECDQIHVGELSTNEKNHSSAVDNRMNESFMSVHMGRDNHVNDTVSGYESNQPAEILSERTVTGSMSVNDRYEVTSTGLSYDDNDYHDLNEGAESGPEGCDQLHVGELSTKNRLNMSMHDDKASNYTMSSSIDKEKNGSATGDLNQSSLHDMEHCKTEQLYADNPDRGSEMNSGNVSNQITDRHEKVVSQPSKISCENQVITEEMYSRREKEHQTSLWNTYEIDGYFFAEPLSSRNANQSVQKRTLNKQVSFGSSDKTMSMSQPIQREMVMPAKREPKSFASFEELYNETKDLLRFPCVSDVLGVIRTIINSNDPYVQVKNSSIPKDEFVAMLLSTPKNEILETAHTVVENMYGIRNRFSYIKTLLYIAAMKRSGRYSNQSTYRNTNTDCRSFNSPGNVDTYTNTYRNGYRRGNKFNDFDQRNYDYERLERQLLSR